jgi:hypothetical protein
MVRVDRATFETMSIRPQPGPGEPALRWHWDTPLILSPHDPKVVYAAANKVFRSPDRGQSWIAISPDLTGSGNRDNIVTMGVKGSDIQISRNDGISAWPTIVALAESPKRAGLLYAGTDDGRLAVSRDAGKTWAQIIDKVPGLPQGIFVSEIAPSRFDEATVYATFDGHRQNDFETYIYASADSGQTWRSVAANLKGEVARTLTEDLKNRDVLYLGTETGLFVSIDRARSWTRIKANLPTVRIDEITLHPRDNAMILATHGRSIWILDHLEPIQEFAGTLGQAQGSAEAAKDARLFTPPPSVMYRRPARDRNYEFWGDQTFCGENPPQAAVLSWYLKRQVGEVKIKIADAAGREVREIGGPVLASSNKAGVQSACWDLRVAPLPAAVPPASSGQAPSTGAGGSLPASSGQAASTGAASAAQAASGPGGAGGGPGSAAAPSPFGAGCGTSSGGPGGGSGGGAAPNGPFVLPGTYTISLIIDGKTIETKPLRVSADPEVALTELQRKKMFDMAMDMHEVQRSATEVANAIRPVNARVAEIAKAIGSRTGFPADVKATFDAFSKDLATLATKFAAPAGGFGGGGSGGGTGPPSLLTRIGQAKNGLMGGLWHTEQILRTYDELKIETPKAVADANALFAKAAGLSGALAKLDLKLAVPEPVKLPQLLPAKK